MLEQRILLSADVLGVAGVFDGDGDDQIEIVVDDAAAALENGAADQAPTTAEGDLSVDEFDDLETGSEDGSLALEAEIDVVEIDVEEARIP